MHSFSFCVPLRSVTCILGINSTGSTSRPESNTRCACSRFVACKNTAPRYLSDYCIPVATLSGRSHLRSAASGSLFVPACRTVTIGPRAFAVACPKSWNSLPQDLRVPGITQGEFRKQVEKLFLFEEMLSDRLWGYFSHSSEQLLFFCNIHVIFRT